MKWILFLSALLISIEAKAQDLVAIRNIPAKKIIEKEDVQFVGRNSELAAAILGKEARISLFKGKSITIKDVVEPALVERNQAIGIVFNVDHLSISVSGRAMERGSFGQRIRVMNVSSKKTFEGFVSSQGQVQVSGLQ